MQGRIRSIKWSHERETITCTIGEEIRMELDRAAPGSPEVRFDSGLVTRIEDAGTCYFVWHDFDESDSEWPAVFMVGKHHWPVVES